MNYELDTFWDIYWYGLHPICGTVVVVIAFAIFVAGLRDVRERRLFWVTTILAVSLLGFCVGEWFIGAERVSRFGISNYREETESWVVRTTQARMMFMAQAALAVTFALALLWWPIRPKED